MLKKVWLGTTKTIFFLFKKDYFMKKWHKATRKVFKKLKNTQNYVQYKWEFINIRKQSLELSPQAWYQSNKVPTNEARRWPSSSPHPQTCDCSTPSKYITSNTKVSNSKCQDECFPNQFFHPIKRSSALLGRTQVIPNDLKTKLHN